MQQRQRVMLMHSMLNTRRLADAKAENDALQRKLDNGGGVLVKGNAPAVLGQKPQAPPGMGNDTAGTLPVAGRNVLGVRTGIRDQTAPRTLPRNTSGRNAFDDSDNFTHHPSHLAL